MYRISNNCHGRCFHVRLACWKSFGNTESVFKVLCKHIVSFVPNNIITRHCQSNVIVLIMKLPFPIGLRNYSNSTLSSVDLKTVPADIPLDIARLDLSKNNIKQLRPKEFVSVKDLKLLNLSGNSLESIDTGKPMVHNEILSSRHILICLSRNESTTMMYKV